MGIRGARSGPNSPAQGVNPVRALTRRRPELQPGRTRPPPPPGPRRLPAAPPPPRQPLNSSPVPRKISRKRPAPAGRFRRSSQPKFKKINKCKKARRWGRGGRAAEDVLAPRPPGGTRAPRWAPRAWGGGVRGSARPRPGQKGRRVWRRAGGGMVRPGPGLRAARGPAPRAHRHPRPGLPACAPPPAAAATTTTGGRGSRGRAGGGDGPGVGSGGGDLGPSARSHHRPPLPSPRRVCGRATPPPAPHPPPALPQVGPRGCRRRLGAPRRPWGGGGTQVQRLAPGGHPPVVLPPPPAPASSSGWPDLHDLLGPLGRDGGWGWPGRAARGWG